MVSCSVAYVWYICRHTTNIWKISLYTQYLINHDCVNSHVGKWPLGEPPCIGNGLNEVEYHLLMLPLVLCFRRGNDCALFPGEEDIDAEDIDHQALLEEDYEEFLL